MRASSKHQTSYGQDILYQSSAILDVPRPIVLISDPLHLIHALQIARVLGGIFLVVQIILILEFMFVINDYLVDRDACKAVLIIGSVILFIGSFAVSALAFYYYGRSAACKRNICFIAFTAIGGISLTLLSVSLSSFLSLGSTDLLFASSLCITKLWQAYSCLANCSLNLTHNAPPGKPALYLLWRVMKS